MQMTLDRDATLDDGMALPALWHWLYFLETAPLSGLGRDGHPAKGGFLPPVALPRRMWAGGRLGFMRPLVLGEEARKISTIRAVTPKNGRSGPLCFVTVRHEIAGPDGPALWEEHDIVYRADPAPGPPAATPTDPVGADWETTRQIVPSEVMLFRYSALTFNGHRIHYDRDYATGVEGHAGLVVHGPLIATLLADLATSRRGDRMRAFSFRAVAPVFDTAPFTLHARGDGPREELAAATAEGRIAMRATATF
ncbi:MaoC family dehydratase N-terminal domain-containing protein [Sulfitobacter albidus]|uniref:MaoC family dehydratase N-terminal domain-containing protein n=2 Tax=Sulfitobacter albidus TaxID=2829501 RepID=A0A975JGA1_9RHOB|nr:MaoC family dehydratase N-terminal domain-containing protein [Sulfitobacter albidus]